MPKTTDVHSDTSVRVGVAAELLGVSVDTLRRWTASGRLRVRRSGGGQRLVALADLRRLQEERRKRERSVVAQSRRLLTDGLMRLGFAVEPSQANFVLVHVGDGASFRRALLPHGLVVRDCASFGLPASVRIACRLPAECQRLIETVARVL